MTLSTAATRGLDNYTVTLPSSPLGAWTLTTVFQNTGGFDKLPFDYGIMSHSFRIEELQLKSSSFAATGGVGRGASLNIIGSLMYASDSSSASNLNATVFAVASGPGASLVSTTVTASTGLYISNMTMVNATTDRPAPKKQKISQFRRLLWHVNRTDLGWVTKAALTTLQPGARARRVALLNQLPSKPE